MDGLNECTICRSHAKCDSGFFPAESIEYAYCSNEDCIFHLIENNHFTKDEWNSVNKPSLTPMQKAAPEMYEMLKVLLPQIAGSPAALKVNRLLAKARGEQ